MASASTSLLAMFSSISIALLPFLASAMTQPPRPASLLNSEDTEQDTSAFTPSLHAPMLMETAPILAPPESGRIAIAAFGPEGYLQMLSRTPLIRKATMEATNEASADAPIRVHYGVMSNMGSRGPPLLRGQIETWAAELVEQGRFFAVIGNNTNIPSDLRYRNDIITPVACKDDHQSVQCKEARSFEVAYQRDLDWLVRMDDDTYVNSKEIEQYLTSLGHEALQQPVVLSMSIGCGVKMDIVKELCPKLFDTGGICGGGGYAINKAAMKALESTAGGWTQLVADYEDYKKHGVSYGDLCTSCELSKRGIPIQQFWGTAAINGVMTKKAWKVYLADRPVMYHDLSGELIHWIHATLQGKPQTEIEALEKAAFDDWGCCCDNSARARRWKSPAKAKEACHSGTLDEKPVLCGYNSKLVPPKWLSSSFR